MFRGLPQLRGSSPAILHHIKASSKARVFNSVQTAAIMRGHAHVVQSADEPLRQACSNYEEDIR
jgi:hypothetical protein